MEVSSFQIYGGSKMITVKEDGSIWEKDEEVLVASQTDLESAIFALQYHFNLTRLRGDPMIMQIWTPKIAQGGYE